MVLATWTLPPNPESLVTTTACVAIAICALATVATSSLAPLRIRRAVNLISPAFFVGLAVIYPDSPIIINRFFWHSEWVGLICFLVIGAGFGWHLMGLRSRGLFIYGASAFLIGSYFSAEYAGSFLRAIAFDSGVRFPSWIGAATTAAIAAILLAIVCLRYFIERPRMRTNESGICPTCGYDMRGTPPDHPCPECGELAAAKVKPVTPPPVPSPHRQ